MDAREKKLNEIIAGVPAIHQEAACLVWNMAIGAAVDAMSGAKSAAAVDAISGAMSVAAVDAMSGSNRLEVLQGMASDMEHLICDTENKVSTSHTRNGGGFH